MNLVLTIAILLACFSADGLAHLCLAKSNSKPMILGIATHLVHASIPDIDRTITSAKTEGFTALRWDASWQMMEKEKGVLIPPQKWDYIVNKSRAAGLETVLILDYGNKFYDDGDKPISAKAQLAFARYAASLANHFKGRVRYLQIWNEWNGKVGGTTPGRSSDYAQLLKRVYPAIKSVDPNYKVIAGAFSSTAYNSLINSGVRDRQFEDLIALDDLGSYLDIIAIHPYIVYRTSNERGELGFRRLLKAIVKATKATPSLKDKPIFITEVGWSTAGNPDFGIPEAKQAELLHYAISISMESHISGLFIYELRDGDETSKETEAHFGILRADWSRKSFRLKR